MRWIVKTTHTVHILFEPLTYKNVFFRSDRKDKNSVSPLRGKPRPTPIGKPNAWLN